MMRLLKDLKSFGTEVYRTDLCGEISIDINKLGKIHVKKFIDD